MKTRLLIASIFTVAAALLLAVTLRTSASAQEEAEPEPEPVIEGKDEEGVDPVAGIVAAENPEPAAVEGETPPEEETGAGPSSVEVPEAERGELPGVEERTEFPLGEEGFPDGSDLNEPDAEESAADGSVEEGDEGAGEVEGSEELGNPEEMEAPEETETPEAALTFDFDEEVQETSVALSQEPGTITVDFPDEEIRTILRLVADMFELNLVIPETLIGRASLKLRDVTWRQVFDVVLSPVGFTYVEEGNIIKVVSLESLSLEPPLTRVVILDYAKADAILASIQPMVDAGAGGRVQVDQHSNALVITERPTVLRRIEETIKALDTPKVQVMIESKFIETRSRDIKNIGVNWASLDNYGLRAGPFTQSYERESGSSSQDGRDVTSGSSAQQGQTSQSSTTNGTSTSSTTTTNSSQVQNGVDALDSSLDFTDTTRFSSAVFSADQFNVILSALRTTNDVKLVSNPTVVVLDGMPARIHIGDEYPIVRPQYNPETGTYLAGELEMIDIGIKLDVTPDVKKAGGFINLEVEPDVSTLSGFVTQFGADYPIRATRNAKSFVTIKDGFTLAIGGLVQEDTSNVETRVPVLGSIPVLGRLFRSDSKDNDQRNLIIFLTARTLSPDGSTVEETVDPRKIHNMGLTREELPGYRPKIAMWPEEEVPPEATDDGVAELELEEASVEEDSVVIETELLAVEEEEVNALTLDASPEDRVAEEVDAVEPSADNEGNDSSAGEGEAEALDESGEVVEEMESVDSVNGASDDEADTEVGQEEEQGEVKEAPPEKSPSRGWLTPGA